MKAPLLVELLTEELPPKALKALGASFASSIHEELVSLGLAAGTTGRSDFATPRRLAVLIPGVSDQVAGEDREVQGPSVSAAPPAVAGFARKHGVTLDALQRRATPKGEVFVARVQAGGASLDSALPAVVEKAVRKLPIPKVMRWGDGEARFVRPVHGLVMLHGARVVPGSVLGLASGHSTFGHRFLSSGAVKLASAQAYEEALEKACVVASFEKRRAAIERQLRARAAELGGALGGAESLDALLDEVTALVEFPVVYAASFDAAYLEVPQECLILTMRQNQKYFPLFDPAGKLLPRFLIVSNMKVADPKHIIGGNQRVVRPRLEDAKFFYAQDRRERLEARLPRLAGVVYHAKLGSQRERAERLMRLSGRIARALSADPATAQRAGLLAKADLLTGMVGEFPELQGVMGRYYALHDGEAPEVADAIEAHYRPRFAGDALPEGPGAAAVALADKLDTLAGLFGIDEQPTGEKDPFGLRRAALGLIRIVVERGLQLRLDELIAWAFELWPSGTLAAAQARVADFVYARLEGYLKERGFTTLQVDAVLALRPARLDLVPRQLEAVKAFQGLPEAESLAAANKRVANLLRQAQAKGEAPGATADGLKEDAELRLCAALKNASSAAIPMLERGDYAGYLRSFASLKSPVDAFFDQVMVMVEDRELRQARLALLRDLREAMNRVADISRLAQ